jgi:5'-nucleotidase
LPTTFETIFMNTSKKQILLTNDDGILSPGLWSAARVLSELGFVTVVAPREQFSGAGRSLPIHSDGIIEPKEVQVNGQSWKVYAVGGSPAQAVQHGILEVLPKVPDLVVSGINYGENIGTGVTTSGTIGAALEAAALGIPAIATSLETPIEYHYSFSERIDFSAAGHFTKEFARFMLNREMPQDVDVLKIDVPFTATINTPWEITRISRVRIFEPVPPQRNSWDQPGLIGYKLRTNNQTLEAGTDAHAIQIKKAVSVTPLSLDLTSRIDLDLFEKELRS